MGLQKHKYVISFLIVSFVLSKYSQGQGLLEMLIHRQLLQQQLEYTEGSNRETTKANMSTSGCDPTTDNCTVTPEIGGDIRLNPIQEPPQPADIPTPPIVTPPECSNASSSPIKMRVEDFSCQVQQFIKRANDTVMAMAAVAEEAFKFRQRLILDCVCMPNRCANTFKGDNFTCGQELGTLGECGGVTGSMYSTEQGFVGTAFSDAIPPTNLTKGMKASVCMSKHFEKAIPDFKSNNASSWVYMGFETGTNWLWPGTYQSRSKESGLESWHQCIPYDPRARPWYHEGATGPMDIVLVVDISYTMNEFVRGTRTRWDIVQEALVKFVDTLTFSDYFNIVFFNHQPIVWYSKALVKGDLENKQSVKQFILNNQPTGSTSFLEAFEEAFDVLILGEESGNSTGCNKVILFLTDGKDTQMNKRLNRTQEILDKVESKQVELELASGTRARIFSFSTGEEADDLIPRQLACLHNGSWSPIQANDDPLQVFSTYLKFPASARNEKMVYWSEVYEDAFGLGEMITVSLPVFTPEVDAQIPGALFGVAGSDVQTSRLQELAGDDTELLIQILQQNSLTCSTISISQCQQQVLRSEQFQCPNLSHSKARCAKFVNKQNEERYYVKSAEALPWSEAYSTCQAKGGQLAVPNAADELSFLAGYAAVEGSWLGIIYDEPSNTWTWLDSNPDAVLLSEDSYWAFEQPYLEIDSTSILCGTIAPSGSAHNMYSQTCISKFSYICEYEVPTEFCQKGDIEDLTKEDYVYTMPQIDQCTGDEGLDTLRFFETLSLPQLDEITADDQFCYDNFTGSSAKSYNDLVCCS
eukprot:TRINITY_DN12168_c0_g2_i4.p1 TRINITY_DN12168_c0_g2~~TRINITY_DN12168_c0_g2_i4.p1  ORF type:complete len:811 (-),score=62.68 TRINITY_DN12168_c0_g2_i4:521-2953(-)